MPAQPQPPEKHESSWEEILSELKALENKFPNENGLGLLVAVIESNLLGKTDDLNISVSTLKLEIKAGEKDENIRNKLAIFIQQLQNSFSPKDGKKVDFLKTESGTTTNIDNPQAKKKLELPETFLTAEQYRQRREKVEALLDTEATEQREKDFFALYEELCIEHKTRYASLSREHFDRQKEELTQALVNIARREILDPHKLDITIGLLKKATLEETNYDAFIRKMLIMLIEITLFTFKQEYRAFRKKFSLEKEMYMAYSSISEAKAKLLSLVIKISKTTRLQKPGSFTQVDGELRAAVEKPSLREMSVHLSLIMRSITR